MSEISSMQFPHSCRFCIKDLQAEPNPSIIDMSTFSDAKLHELNVTRLFITSVICNIYGTSFN